MLRRLRENGPIVLVPLAWSFATAAHLELLASRTVLIAHIVMVSIIAAFTVLSWGEMAAGILLAWRRVLLAGFVITLVGVLGLLADPQIRPLLSVTVVGWMLVPAAGLAYTGQHIARTSGRKPRRCAVIYRGVQRGLPVRCCNNSVGAFKQNRRADLPCCVACGVQLGIGRTVARRCIQAGAP